MITIGEFIALCIACLFIVAFFIIGLFSFYAVFQTIKVCIQEEINKKWKL